MKLPTALIVTLLAAGASFAQTATTTPVGFVTFNYAKGTQYSGVPMVNASVFAAKVSSVSGSNITASSAIGSALTAGTAYYLEVTTDASGAYVGDRLDIDTAATIAAGGSTLVVKASAENTMVVTAALNGVSFVVRPHVTVAQLTASGVFKLNDLILIRTVNSAGVFSQVSMKYNGTNWKQGLITADTTVVYPGVGFILVRTDAASTSGILTGEVRTNNFVQVIQKGSQVLAEGFPVDSAAKPSTTTVASRMFTNDQGASTFVTGDKLVWNGGAASATYYTTGDSWKQGLTNVNATVLFDATKGVYIVAGTANPNYVQVRPFSL
jgi:hypothetical protein